MNENRFIVDLGDITLTDEDRNKINQAIQQAVSKELLNIAKADNPVAFPFVSHDKDELIRILGDHPLFTTGIIIRDLSKGALPDFAKLQTTKSFK